MRMLTKDPTARPSAEMLLSDVPWARKIAASLLITMQGSNVDADRCLLPKTNSAFQQYGVDRKTHGDHIDVVGTENQVVDELEAEISPHSVTDGTHSIVSSDDIFNHTVDADGRNDVASAEALSHLNSDGGLLCRTYCSVLDRSDHQQADSFCDDRDGEHAANILLPRRDHPRSDVAFEPRDLLEQRFRASKPLPLFEDNQMSRT